MGLAAHRVGDLHASGGIVHLDLGGDIDGAARLGLHVHGQEVQVEKRVRPGPEGHGAGAALLGDAPQLVLDRLEILRRALLRSGVVVADAVVGEVGKLGGGLGGVRQTHLGRPVHIARGHRIGVLIIAVGVDLRAVGGGVLHLVQQFVEFSVGLLHRKVVRSGNAMADAGGEEVVRLAAQPFHAARHGSARLVEVIAESSQ